VKFHLFSEIFGVHPAAQSFGASPLPSRAFQQLDGGDFLYSNPSFYKVCSEAFCDIGTRIGQSRPHLLAPFGGKHFEQNEFGILGFG
jgi:hypothetical protein